MSETIIKETVFTNPAEHLHKAKEAIKILGWGQNTYLNEDSGKVCALGALRAVSFGVYKNSHYHHKLNVYPSEWGPIYRAEEILSNAMADYGYSNMAEWNDKVERTVEDVLQLYDNAIALLEDK